MGESTLIRRLSGADLPAAVTLSTAVGWNQTPGDWQRLLALAPDGCIGAWRGGRDQAELVGTATLVTYGGIVSWLGMVIVAESERGRGVGKELVAAALSAAPPSGRGVLVGLDATALGAPLYERAGFAAVAAIDRWRGTLREPAAGTAGTEHATRLGPSDSAAVVRLDSTATGIDRSALLRYFLAEDGVGVYGARQPAVAGLAGYVVVRPGREAFHVGPLVATNVEVREALLAAASRHAAGRTVLLDAVREEERSSWLSASGLSVARTLQRMTRPARPVMAGPAVVAAAAFEWG